jgi:thiol:disulfide interchange protein
MKNKKRFAWMIILFLLFANAQAQILNPVKWISQTKYDGNRVFEISFTASIDQGWHVYSSTLDPNQGPVPTTLTLDKSSEYQSAGLLQESGNQIQKYDSNFEETLKYFENKVIFSQKIKLNVNSARVSGNYQYMVCDASRCLPPVTKSFSFDLIVPDSIVSKIKDTEKKSSIVPVIADTSSGSNQKNTVPDTAASKTVTISQQIVPIDSAGSVWQIFLKGIIAGFAALLQPCVFPIIPLTVSFFTKRNSDKSKGRRDALFYGFSILIIFMILGFIMTFIFGPSALNSLSSSAVFNLFFFAIIILFALSFLGVFELSLPNSWLNKSEQIADKGGLLGIFFMAFSLVLISFSCTVPIVGSLLVLISKGSWLNPIIGLGSFGLSIAIPFAFFAFFPGLLKSLPKSGGWMNTLKVTLGFLELALAFIYLSKVDLAYHWQILSRDIFLSIWIIVFSVLGFYLLGKIKLSHDDNGNKISVVRLLAGMIVLTFSLYMIPGLWGAPLNLISGYLPPIGSQEFNLTNSTTSADPASFKVKKYGDRFSAPYNLDIYFDYDQGIEVAKKLNKPVFLDFTGWACVNCRKMESNVWRDAQVQKLFRNDYVMISMYVDDKTNLPDSEQYVSKLSGVKIKTLGDKNSDIQTVNYNTNSQPYYVLIDPFDLKQLSAPKAYDVDINGYIKFLSEGYQVFNIKHNSK